MVPRHDAHLAGEGQLSPIPILQHSNILGSSRELLAKSTSTLPCSTTRSDSNRIGSTRLNSTRHNTNNSNGGLVVSGTSFTSPN